MKRRKVQRVPITEVSPSLRQLARRIHQKKSYLILEDKGEPIVGIMDADELEDYLEVTDPQMQKQIEEGYQEYLRGEIKEDAWEHLARLEQQVKKPKRARKRA
jgi:hypothetical protein